MPARTTCRCVLTRGTNLYVLWHEWIFWWRVKCTPRYTVDKNHTHLLLSSWQKKENRTKYKRVICVTSDFRRATSLLERELHVEIDKNRTHSLSSLQTKKHTHTQRTFIWTTSDLRRAKIVFECQDRQQLHSFIVKWLTKEEEKNKTHRTCISITRLVLCIHLVLHWLKNRTRNLTQCG